ncbi:protein disulfide-isomerase [Deltaproteobacteria bacterium]|nr:protein disulfide-isomerase [Deltaproteobacteria bacterium]
MRIEIWSDVICPWCGLGQHRLDAALAAFADRGEVEVVHRSFELDPSFPAGKVISAPELLRTKYRLDDAQIAAATGRIEALAASDGLTPYNVGNNVVGNTRLAHELLAMAADHGMEAEAWKRLYRAYFGEGRSIFDVDSLAALGQELGLGRDAVREALSTGRYTATVRADGAAAKALGCTGVPFVVIDGKFRIAGAQATGVFRSTIERAWASRAIT